MTTYPNNNGTFDFRLFGSVYEKYGEALRKGETAIPLTKEEHDFIHSLPLPTP